MKRRIIVLDPKHEWTTKMWNFLEDKDTYDLECYDSTFAMMRALKKGRQPSMIVMEMTLLEGNGINALEQAKKWAPFCPVLFYTSTKDNELNAQAIYKGAYSILYKDQGSEQKIASLVDEICGEFVEKEKQKLNKATLNAVVVVVMVNVLLTVLTVMF